MNQNDIVEFLKKKSKILQDITGRELCNETDYAEILAEWSAEDCRNFEDSLREWQKGYDADSGICPWCARARYLC